MFRNQFMPAFLCLVAILLGGCGNKRAQDEPEACTMNVQYLLFANNLRRLADAKELCGYMQDETTANLGLCSGQLPFATLSQVRTCRDLEAMNADVVRWLEAHLPAAKEACQQQEGGSCTSFLFSKVTL